MTYQISNFTVYRTFTAVHGSCELVVFYSTNKVGHVVSLKYNLFSQTHVNSRVAQKSKDIESTIYFH
jgi:hypothetical protein